MKIKVGIFFGGSSSKRELSFATGRTVFENLNRSIFEPVPIFLDSLGNLIELDWKNFYKGKIRDFYPPKNSRPPSPNNFDIYVESIWQTDPDSLEDLIEGIGKKIRPADLPQMISIAFLALFEEHSSLTDLLQEQKIPFTGDTKGNHQLARNREDQSARLAQEGFPTSRSIILTREEWLKKETSDIFQNAIEELDFPMSVRPAMQALYSYPSVIKERSGEESFAQSINRAFSMEVIPINEWIDRNEFERDEYVRLLSDVEEGLRYPIKGKFRNEQKTFTHPEDLLYFLNEWSVLAEDDDNYFILEGDRQPDKVIIEHFEVNRMFNCSAVRAENGQPLPLLPTESIFSDTGFGPTALDAPHQFPIDLPGNKIKEIRELAVNIFKKFQFQTFANLEGSISENGQIYIRDLNTASGLIGTDLLFRQFAEAGLTPSQVLTYFIRTSLLVRTEENPQISAYKALLKLLDDHIQSLHLIEAGQKRIGIIFGGFSADRHASLKSGRAIFEKLSAAEKYSPIPIFLTGDEHDFQLVHIPFGLLSSADADTLEEKLQNFAVHPETQDLRAETEQLTRKYAGIGFVQQPVVLSFEDLEQMVDGVFIALHGRPGEDGQLQKILDTHKIGYTGSRLDALANSLDKRKTNQLLAAKGIPVTNQFMTKRSEFEQDPAEFFERIESRVKLPCFAKPVDGGYGAAVKKISNRRELEAYVQLMFRPEGQQGQEFRRVLKLKAKEEFPRKNVILFESLISPNGADHFQEITCGVLAHPVRMGTPEYEAFEPAKKMDPQEHNYQLPTEFASDEDLDLSIRQEVRAKARLIGQLLNLQGVATVDGFVRVDNNKQIQLIVIETNALPELTPDAIVIRQAALAGYQPYELYERLIQQVFKENYSPVTTTAAYNAVITSGQTQTIATMSSEKDNPENPFDVETNKASMPETEGQPSGQYSFLDDLKARLKSFGLTIWDFLKSPAFLKNFGALIALGILFLLSLGWILKTYTKHGDSLQVQNYIGMDLEEAKRKARSRSFKVVVIDSIFEPDKKPGEIYQQDPRPLSRVKENRTIYLSVYGSTPPMMKLPSLVGSYDFNQYKKKLKSKKINAVVKERKFDSKLEENTILHFYYDGQKITDSDLRRGDGVMVPQGSTLEFVITERNTGTIPIPNLVCKNYNAATFLITSMNCILGTVHGDVLDQESTYVWKQEPAFDPNLMVLVGTQIDIYVSQSRPSGCPEEDTPAELEEGPFDEGGGEDFDQ